MSDPISKVSTSSTFNVAQEVPDSNNEKNTKVLKRTFATVFENQNSEFYTEKKTKAEKQEISLEKRVTLEEEKKFDVKTKLSSQMKFGMDQMQEEPTKKFKYERAPDNWVLKEGQEPSKLGAHEEAKQVDGYSVGISHAIGPSRKTMEDEYLATSFNLKIGEHDYPVQLFAVIDGHGGRDAAIYVRDHLQKELEKALLDLNSNVFSDENIWHALKNSMDELNSHLKKDLMDKSNRFGATATIVMILDNQLWTANVGDARTVLDNQGTAFLLSEDAKASNLRYKKGIEKLGGKVELRKNTYRVNGSLAVARAFGDAYLKGMITARPKITMKPLGEIEKGSHLILGCDGIFDVASTKQVVEAAHANQSLTAVELARDVVFSAQKCGSKDNMTCMVVKL